MGDGGLASEGGLQGVRESGQWGGREGVQRGWVTRRRGRREGEGDNFYKKKKFHYFSIGVYLSKMT